MSYSSYAERSLKCLHFQTIIILFFMSPAANYYLAFVASHSCTIDNSIEQRERQGDVLPIVRSI